MRQCVTRSRGAPSGRIARESRATGCSKWRGEPEAASCKLQASSSEPRAASAEPEAGSRKLQALSCVPVPLAPQLLLGSGGSARLPPRTRSEAELRRSSLQWRRLAPSGAVPAPEGSDADVAQGERAARARGQAAPPDRAPERGRCRPRAARAAGCACGPPQGRICAAPVRGLSAMVSGVPGLAPLALGYVCAAPYQGLSADTDGGSSDYGATPERFSATLEKKCDRPKCRGGNALRNHRAQAGPSRSRIASDWVQ